MHLSRIAAAAAMASLSFEPMLSAVAPVPMPYSEPHPSRKWRRASRSWRGDEKRKRREKANAAEAARQLADAHRRAAIADLPRHYFYREYGCLASRSTPTGSAS